MLNQTIGKEGKIRGGGGVSVAALLLSRFKSKKGTNLQCGQSLREILP